MESPPASMAARSPDRFLSDLHDFIDHGDLNNEKEVAETFRLRLTVHSMNAVLNPRTNILEGTSSAFQATPLSTETLVNADEPKTNYGKFKSNDSSFEKSSLSEGINEAEICIKKERFVSTWGVGEPQFNPSFRGQLTYNFLGRNKIEMYLLFTKTGCLHDLTLYQNRRNDSK
ncbi:hypothetical protein [uncultured Caballeronia sp.]|jgi:hypothetical protein|uniref:hypothetical protein n=1 Tax=uncultured Caballeronia sp. TaxID=1827198 RepID=UPI0015772527